MKRKTNQHSAALTNRTTLRVRFSEIDSMQIVWHGEYVRYFEDGREAFGKQYGLDYMSIYREGYMVPIVDLTCQFKQSLSFGEEAIIETRYIACDAAKIHFEYVIYRATDQSVVATGSTIQVFLNLNKELELVNPPFYTEWKKKWNILEYIHHSPYADQLVRLRYRGKPESDPYLPEWSPSAGSRTGF